MVTTVPAPNDADRHITLDSLNLPRDQQHEQDKHTLSFPRRVPQIPNDATHFVLRIAHKDHFISFGTERYFLWAP